VETRHLIYSRPGVAKTMKKITESVVNGILESRENPRSPFGDDSILKTVQHETLVLWTKHNPGQYWEDVQKYATNLPNHRFYLMEEAGHWPQWERADEFNHVHLNFLRFGIQKM
jgi:2-hydroxy-6-oxonona-2,4-dienedioate hydrolase